MKLVNISLLVQVREILENWVFKTEIQIMELKIKLVRTPQEQKNVLDIRRSVFIDEQQIPVEIEIDAFEESAIYVIAYFDEEAVGTARWREIGNCWPLWIW